MMIQDKPGCSLQAIINNINLFFSIHYKKNLKDLFFDTIKNVESEEILHHL